MVSDPHCYMWCISLISILSPSYFASECLDTCVWWPEGIETTLLKCHISSFNTLCFIYPESRRITIGLVAIAIAHVIGLVFSSSCKIYEYTTKCICKFVGEFESRTGLACMIWLVGTSDISSNGGN